MEFYQLSTRIYCLKYDHYADRPNLGYIQGDTHCLMFDLGGSPDHVHEFYAALRQNNLQNPDFAVLSHWHCDHSLGITALSIPVIASQLTNQKLLEMERWTWDETAIRLRIQNHEETEFGYDMLCKEYEDLSTIQIRRADIIFKETLSVELGGVTCVLHHIGGPHSPDSTICLIPEDGVLFLGDSYGKDMMGLDWDYNPNDREHFRRTLHALPYARDKIVDYCKYLMDMDFTVCVGGHTDPMSKESLLTYIAQQPVSG